MLNTRIANKSKKPIFETRLALRQPLITPAPADIESAASTSRIAPADIETAAPTSRKLQLTGLPTDVLQLITNQMRAVDRVNLGAVNRQFREMLGHSRQQDLCYAKTFEVIMLLVIMRCDAGPLTRMIRAAAIIPDRHKRKALLKHAQYAMMPPETQLSVANTLLRLQSDNVLGSNYIYDVRNIINSIISKMLMKERSQADAQPSIMQLTNTTSLLKKLSILSLVAFITTAAVAYFKPSAWHKPEDTMSQCGLLTMLLFSLGLALHEWTNHQRNTFALQAVENHLAQQLRPVGIFSPVTTQLDMADLQRIAAIADRAAEYR